MKSTESFETQDETTENTDNPYYAAVSVKLRNTKYLLLVLMVIAAVLTLWAYRSNITYDNFRYLLRDMDEAGNAGAVADSVFYTASDTNYYTYFRGDIAVCSTEGVAFHRSLGSRAFTDTVSVKSPVADVSDKYMIVYDVGGYTFYLYNAISRVYDETFEYPIYDGAAADSGAFAVLTKNKTGSYLIRTYDKNFNLTAELVRGGFVYDIGYLSDGRLFICECEGNGAFIKTSYSVYSEGNDETDFTLTENGFVLMSGSLSNGFYILFDGSLSFYDKSGEKTFTTSFGTSDVLRADATEKGVCVYTDENVSGVACGVYAFFADGSSLSSPVDKGAKGIALCGKRVCLLYDGQLLICDGENNTYAGIQDGGRALLRKSADTVIVCYNDYAKTVDIK